MPISLTKTHDCQNMHTRSASCSSSCCCLHGGLTSVYQAGACMCDWAYIYIYIDMHVFIIIFILNVIMAIVTCNFGVLWLLNRASCICVSHNNSIALVLSFQLSFLFDRKRSLFFEEMENLREGE